MQFELQDDGSRLQNFGSDQLMKIIMEMLALAVLNTVDLNNAS